MLIIPAIDLQDGCVVRYVQGKTGKKIYSRDPIKTAKHWVKQGAQLLHVVDLDGAFSGKPKNIEIVKAIARETGIPIEFGGGVRKIEMIRMLLEAGIQRIVLGTKAIEDKSFLKRAFKDFKEQVIVSIDAKGAMVLTQGWRNSSRKMDALAFAFILRDIGFKQLIYTDTLKDGTLNGPNIKGIKSLLKETRMRLIASGGISNLDDIFKLKKLEKNGLVGVIIGKALYEGRFTLTEALKMG